MYLCSITEYGNGGKYFRLCAVPYTRCIRSGYGNFRYPKHKNHIDSLGDPNIKEFNIKIRVKKTNIVTAWDDIRRSDYKDRSWKNHRHHQWKGNE